MNDNKSVKLYNLFLPLWLIFWFPSYLWLIVIPVNYIIDRLVLTLSLKGQEDRKTICRKYTWKIWLAGFLADFVGMLIILGSMMLFSAIDVPFLNDTADALVANAFTSIPALLITLIAIAVAGLLIFVIDRRILKNSGLDAAQIKKSALYLALITAPYLYLIPSALIYGSAY